MGKINDEFYLLCLCKIKMFSLFFPEIFFTTLENLCRDKRKKKHFFSRTWIFVFEHVKGARNNSFFVINKTRLPKQTCSNEEIFYCLNIGKQ